MWVYTYMVLVVIPIFPPMAGRYFALRIKYVLLSLIEDRLSYGKHTEGKNENSNCRG